MIEWNQAFGLVLGDSWVGGTLLAELVGNGDTDVDPLAPLLEGELLVAKLAAGWRVWRGEAFWGTTELLLMGPPITPNPNNKIKTINAKPIRIPATQQHVLHKGYYDPL